MRLNEILSLIKSNRFASPARNQNVISGYFELRNSIINLSKISLLNKEIRSLKKFGGIFLNDDDSFILYGEPMNDFIQALNDYNYKLDLIEDIIDQMLSKQEDNSIVVRAPNSTDFNQHIKFLQNINTAISQIVINKEVQGKSDLIRYEIGSSWIVIGLGSILAVQIVASTFWAAAVIRKKWLEVDFTKEQCRTLKIKNDAQEILVKGLDASVQEAIELEARNVIAQNNVKLEPEYLERVKNSIRMMAELIENGTIINPELITNENVANLFPDLSNISTIISKVKAIAEKSV